MRSREDLLAEIQGSLNAGIITEEDLRQFVPAPPTPIPATPAQPIQPDPPSIVPATPENKPEAKSDKLSAIDVMFYVAGIVLFSAIMSMIVQSWDTGNAFVHILLSAGVGAGLWWLAYYLIKSPIQNDIRKGLVNSLVLTGSLCLIAGGYIATNELIGGFDNVNFIPGAITLAVLGGLHLWFDKLVKRDLTLLMGILLSVASFPALLFGILQDAEVPPDVWSVIIIITAGLLAYAARVVAKLNPDRPKIHNSFDSFAAFVALATMYFSSFTELGVLWLMILIAGVFSIFYLSIIFQNKHLLGSASFFLVLTVITIAFKYFSGFGITASLVLAAIGLLGSAAVATSINKKYFKQAAIETEQADNSTSAAAN